MILLTILFATACSHQEEVASVEITPVVEGELSCIYTGGSTISSPGTGWWWGNAGNPDKTYPATLKGDHWIYDEGYVTERHLFTGTYSFSHALCMQGSITEQPITMTLNENIVMGVQWNEPHVWLADYRFMPDSKKVIGYLMLTESCAGGAQLSFELECEE